MEIHQLRYFCAVARDRNFTRAAAREHVAQPSLSQQILKLEDELGAKLFQRLGRGVRLSTFGETFLPRAKAILRDMSEAKTEIRHMAGSDSGTVVLGVIPTIAPYFLPSHLVRIARAHPFIEIRVVEEITPVLLAQLQEGILDMILVALPLPGHELTFQEILSEPLYAVVPAAHPLARAKSISLKQLKSDPFLLLKEGHCFRESVVSACDRSRLKPNVVFESGQFQTILGMVAAGIGVSVVPRMAASPYKGCRFIPLADDRAHRRIGLAWLRSHFQTRAERFVAEQFLQVAM